jgi:glycosyltransferase involved in cell wall biosynthesis
LIRPLKKEYRVFFFFPFYHIGGAEKVHSQVAQAAGGKDCVIYFTKRSHNELFLKAFRDAGCDIVNISGYTGNKWLYFMNLIWRGVITGHINRQQKQPVVFNGQCNFAYKIAPWIRRNIPQVELIHSLNTFSWIRIPFIPFITRTVMISRKRIEDHVQLYEKLSIPAAFLERIQYIPNAISLPAVRAKKADQPFTVLFVGRGGVEKRLYLVARIAQVLHMQHIGIKFEILGDVTNVMEPSQFEFITFHGNQSDPDFIKSVYDRAHILILTSETEGFPLVIIEAMAHGAAVIATPVGDIPYHVKNGVNGYLFSTVTNETKIEVEGIDFIVKLQKDRQLLNSISDNNVRYATEHFTIEKFNHAYQHLLASIKTTD